MLLVMCLYQELLLLVVWSTADIACGSNYAEQLAQLEKEKDIATSVYYQHYCFGKI
jgi:hypothetical protein